MSPVGHLGIDLGTSAVKVLVQDDHGVVLAKASRSYSIHSPRPGWAEQAPADWWEATCAACSEAAARAGVTIGSVGLSGQLNGFVLLDKAMQPLADAVIWLDIRAEAEAAELAGRIDFPARTGNALSAICVLPKLVWFRANRPDLLAGTHRIALAKDYLLMRLTGELATDPSDAHSTAMTGPGGTAWSTELCALAGVDPGTMPPIRPSSAPAGTISRDAAETTGIPVGTPVATGAGDVAALAVGCGVVEPDLTAITLGTAGHVVAEAIGGRAPAGLGLWQIPHGIGGRDLWLGLIMSGGLSLSWFRSILGFREPPAYDRLEQLAADIAPGSGGVTFLPFLEGAATPYNRPDLRGMFAGLSSAHRTGHLVRAVMEGVMFNARDCIETLAKAGANSHAVRLAEGGAQSSLWCQIIADGLNRPVHLVAERDTSAAGAAMLGWAAATGRPVQEIAEKAVRIARVIEPDAAHTRQLGDAFDRYRAHCARQMRSTDDSGDELDQ